MNITYGKTASTTTIINGVECKVTVVEIDNVYHAYIDADPTEEPSFMFGLPKEQQSLEKALEIAVNTAPDYLDGII